MDQQLFKAEVKKQLYLRNWSYVDLAEHTGYTVRSLRTLMCYKRKMSQGAIEAISRALSIEPPSYEGSREKYHLAYGITGLGELMKDLARQVIDLQDKVDNQAMQLQTLEIKLLQAKLQHLKGQTLNRGDTE